MKIKILISIYLIFISFIFAQDTTINQPENKILKSITLNVGQGDATVIIFPNNKVMQIDAGKAGAYSRDRGLLVIIPFYKKLDINRINIAVASHPDLDHIGGYISIFEDLLLDEFWDAQEYTSYAYKKILKLIDNNNAGYYLGYNMIKDRIEELNKEEYFGKDVKLKIYGPLREYGENNANSLCIKITYKRISFFFLGDSTKEAQEDMAYNWKEDLKTTVMLTPHHGSEHNYSPTFLSYAQPEVAICSVGLKNKYGHPSEKVLAAYAFAGVKVYRTDKLQSHIEVETDGDTYKVNIIKAPFDN